MAIERIIGVDFGTSTSVIRVKRYENGKPVGNGARLDTQKVFDLVPTVIQEMNGHRYYGEEALTPKGRNAIIYRGFKVDLESTDEEKREQARKLTKEFMAYLAAAYKTDSEGGHLGDSTDKERTIISYPVKWSDTTKAFMLEAARKAGFPNVEGMDEAQAAINAVVVQNQEMLLSKKYLQEDLPATILLIDMGAGTTDLVLCRYTPGKQPKNEILATWPKDGNILFGGQEVDELLRNWATELFEDKTQAEFVLKRIPLEQFKAWKETEVAKLLANNETVEQFYTLDDLADMAGVALKPYNLDRVAFESWAESYLKQFPELVKGCLQSAGIAGEQVDLVVLTGGHSQWYFAKEILAGKMPRVSPILLTQIALNPSRIVQVAHPQETAALGMVFSPLSVHFAKEEQTKTETPYTNHAYSSETNTHEAKGRSMNTAAGSNQADTGDKKNNIVDFYRKNAKNLVCVHDRCVCGISVDCSGMFERTNIVDDYGSVINKGIDAFLTSQISPSEWTNLRQLLRPLWGVNEYDVLVGINKDGRVLLAGNHAPFRGTKEWSNIVSVKGGLGFLVGLKKDGSVVATGKNELGQCNVSDWKNVVEVSCGVSHSAGLRKDGTVIATGYTHDGVCNTQGWTLIKSIECTTASTVGLRKDGTVVISGKLLGNMQEIRRWKNITAISCGSTHVVGLKNDGTVVAVGENEADCCNTQNWQNITAISCGLYHTVGLRKDGRVEAIGRNTHGQCNVQNWRDIIAVVAGREQTVGITKNGEVLRTDYDVKINWWSGARVTPRPYSVTMPWRLFDPNASDVITWDDLTQGATFDMSDIDL